MLFPLSFIVTAFAASGAFAQFITDPSDLTIVKSPADENVTVSYREPKGACTTASDDQKQYTGWVNVPGDYPANLFFWFVEAREPTDSLTIWLNGGPGSSSMYGFFTGNGPCEVVEIGLNQYETVAREWGWDKASNMLFIDQPNQVGFSYDVPTNGTLFRAGILQPPVWGFEDMAWWEALNGTFSSLLTDQTANTTEIAANAVWHMLQGFLGAFPQYQPPTRGPVGINLFAESYGGRYGPIFAETFEEQNDKRASGDLDPETTLDLHLISLGIVNGCVDREIQVPLYPVFATNNTYGLKAISDDEADFYTDLYFEEGGCKDLLEQCESLADSKDPDGEGDDARTNRVCSAASSSCDDIEIAYYYFGRSAYDLAAPSQDPFPSMLFLEYLNQGSTLQAIGSPINYTMSNEAVYSEFSQTGDIARGGNVPRLASLLNDGVRVGLIYGDRDYICNWFGGEAVSKKIAEAAGPAYEEGFAAAGYADILVNDSYIGGAVRQFGNLSFSRIYQAGHAVPAYQPETSFQVFDRILSGRSIATGETADLRSYGTEGPDEATETHDLPPEPETTCFVRAFGYTCDDAANELVMEGKGVVINGVLYENESDWSLEDRTSTGGSATQTETGGGGGSAETKTPDDEDAAVQHAPGLVVCIVAVIVAVCVLL